MTYVLHQVFPAFMYADYELLNPVVSTSKPVTFSRNPLVSAPKPGVIHLNPLAANDYT
jgi:hypothetical protein